MSLSDVLTFAQHLASHSFLFRPKADILDKSRSREAEDEEHLNDEEEVEPPPGPPDVGGPKPDEEEVDPLPETADVDGSGSTKLDEEEEVEDANKQRPPCRTTGRTKHKAPDDSADASAPTWKSMRLLKDRLPAGSSARPKQKVAAVVEGSEAGNKVCLML
jgi:hypothetical protein